MGVVQCQETSVPRFCQPRRSPGKSKNQGAGNHSRGCSLRDGGHGWQPCRDLQETRAFSPVISSVASCRQSWQQWNFIQSSRILKGAIQWPLDFIPTPMGLHYDRPQAMGTEDLPVPCLFVTQVFPELARVDRISMKSTTEGLWMLPPQTSWAGVSHRKASPWWIGWGGRTPAQTHIIIIIMIIIATQPCFALQPKQEAPLTPSVALAVLSPSNLVDSRPGELSFTWNHPHDDN
ncbi:hypothetical protein BO78DRAFT_423580 [Aspergillus sclerotiicarbonarius CBS 121057]|uniref:Uncharacterized protein n=1 Tax=Aspergillus sclerotiicarbonarius (strain CBS 121057 / IBT 28362) TaxID=1448318 RepID=A0A319DUI6_ASPSB|nr:hypothetical protein BO78DRAFT_423580 [Aspergillus sclerotiicarbonarius CBS 121057]